MKADGGGSIQQLCPQTVHDSGVEEGSGVMDTQEMLPGELCQ